MAIYHGKNGQVNWDGTDLHKINNWTLNAFVDFLDTTAMEDTWQNGKDGLKDFTATADGLSETTVDTITLLLGAGAVLILETGTTGTDKITGTAIIESFTETCDIEDIGRISYSFVGNDADGLTIAV